jgi:hypothetical protein
MYTLACYRSKRGRAGSVHFVLETVETQEVSVLTRMYIERQGNCEYESSNKRKKFNPSVISSVNKSANTTST